MTFRKGNIFFVPNSLAEFIDLIKIQPLSQIYDNTEIGDRDTLLEYIDFCLFNEFIMEIPQEISKQAFPTLDLNYEYPSIISNLVIKISKSTFNSYGTLSAIISATRCYHIQIIFEENLTDDHIDEFLVNLKDIGLRSVEIIAKFHQNFKHEDLIKKYKNIAYIFLHSAPNSEFIKKHVLGLQQVFTSIHNFEITLKKSLDFFNVDINLFTESINHHTYYNRKLFIDGNGDIKNSPWTKTIFGNINELNIVDEILEIINGSEFQKYWFVHKELIDICNECEFRNMCVDNRVPIRRKENEWYHETECNYNPYIAKWDYEDGYRKLEYCGIKSNENGLMINQEKLSAVNQEIWENE